jgi:hypothetical protein
MPVDPLALRALVARVGEFYVTDKRMKKAQDRIVAELEKGAPGDASVREYLETITTYFSGFEREAREHLRSVDKRLEQINQVHFNLTAERAVAVRRIEATREVLQSLPGLESRP